MPHRSQKSHPVPIAERLPRGVTRTAQGRYQSRIYRNGASVHLGVFDDVDEAAAAYRAAFLSRAIIPIANAPAIEEPPPIAVVEETATTKPQAALQPHSPASWPMPAPGHCPRCNSPLWGPGGSGMAE